MELTSSAKKDGSKRNGEKVWYVELKIRFLIWNINSAETSNFAFEKFVLNFRIYHRCKSFVVKNFSFFFSHTKTLTNLSGDWSWSESPPMTRIRSGRALIWFDTAEIICHFQQPHFKLPNWQTRPGISFLLLKTNCLCLCRRFALRFLLENENWYRFNYANKFLLLSTPRMCLLALSA